MALNWTCCSNTLKTFLHEDNNNQLQQILPQIVFWNGDYLRLHHSLQQDLVRLWRMTVRPSGEELMLLKLY